MKVWVLRGACLAEEWNIPSREKIKTSTPLMGNSFILLSREYFVKSLAYGIYK